MLSDYAAITGQELWNTARLKMYLTNVGSPFTTGADICSCDTLTRTMLEDDPPAPAYDTPATDPAPWYDASLPDSGKFLGFLPLTVSGTDDSTRARNVTNAVGGGGFFGPSRELPRTITVTGLLIGTSCCGVAYGMHWLTEALQGCNGLCGSDCLEMFDCCPDATSTRAAFLAAHRRTFRRTALVSGPTETGRVGDGTCSSACGAGGDIVQVEFVLVAASPQPWTDVTELLDVALPATGTGDCIEWCTGGVGCPQADCRHSPCGEDADTCSDPRSTVPSPPTPTRPAASFCIPIGTDRECYTVDLSARPEWSTDVPVMTLYAGSSELRNVRISMYERPNGTLQTCEEIADANRCAPLNQFYVTYVPPGGLITFDGQTGRATLDCAGSCLSASTAFGDDDGGPVRINPLTCAMYCVCVEVDPLFPPAADARFTFGVSGKGL
jgi:hypothetical protein